MTQGAYPLFAADNYLRDATVTVSTEDTTNDYYALNLQDDRDSTIWKGTGTDPQWAMGDLGPGALTEDWADLADWTETDANGTLGVSGGDLVYDSGANADDSPDLSNDLSLAVDDLFALEVPFDVTAFATAADQAAYLTVEFESGYLVRLKIDSDTGVPRVTFQRDAGAGSWTDVGSYTLSGGTSGRLNLVRTTGGSLTAQAYDDNDAAYHDLGTYAGGANFESTTLTALSISFMVDTRTAGSFQIALDTLYHSDDSGITFFGLAGHDLATQGSSVTLVASVGGVGWTTVQAEITPATDVAFGRIITSGPYRYYKLNIPSGYSSPPGIGVWYLGPYTQFNCWVSGDFNPDGEELVMESARSRDGRFLGRQIDYSDRKLSFTFDHLSLTWFTTWCKPLWVLLKDHPAFVAWDITNHADEVYYLEMEDKSFNAPMKANSRSWSFTMRGVYEE